MRLGDPRGIWTVITRMAVPSQLSPGSRAGIPAIKVSTSTIGALSGRALALGAGDSNPSENKGLQAIAGAETKSAATDEAKMRMGGG